MKTIKTVKKVITDAKKAVERVKKEYVHFTGKTIEKFTDVVEYLSEYDTIIVAFSGGKDSLACLLYLLELGVDKNKIELWHHCIDGKEGSTLMDWACTEDYCRSVAQFFDIPLYFSWKVGGFEGEMLRDGEYTKPTKFEIPMFLDEDNLIECGKKVQESGGDGKGGGNKSTRRKFPMMSGDLSIRWCSAYLKIGVCSSGINGQERFKGKKTLVVSGERGEESSKREKYNEVEADPSDRRDGKRVQRYVDRVRPVHKWTEKQVWEIIERHKVNPHPAYKLGWGRLSCMCCIFGSKNQWSSIREIAPEKFKKISDYEKDFGYTIDRKESIDELADKGTPYKMNSEEVTKSNNTKYNDEIQVDEWELPLGAFGESNGPI